MKLLLITNKHIHTQAHIKLAHRNRVNRVTNDEAHKLQHTLAVIRLYIVWPMWCKLCAGLCHVEIVVNGFDELS